MTLAILILAAGRGTRMHSDLPKVLHPLAGRPLLAHVLATAASLNPAQTVVVAGHGMDRVRAACPEPSLTWVEQSPQRGTGHAVQQAMPSLDAAIDRILVLYGDVPRVPLVTLQQLLKKSEGAALGLLTAEVADPIGYGRILRDTGYQVMGIVEERDASPDQRLIREINTGFLIADRHALAAWLARLQPNNTQGEYYLTDIVALAASADQTIETLCVADSPVLSGVNDRRQLARLERHYQQSLAEEWLLAGVTLLDPARLDIRGELVAGRDVVIDVNVVIEGRVCLGDRVRIGAHCVLQDCEIGADTCVEPFSLIEKSRIGAHARIGPYARIRPESSLGDGVHIGNFVEIKKTIVGEGSKINHLSYIGDAQIGQRVNIGAGTITCNYDGAHKHHTEIGDEAFIGSDTQLVAPVRVGEGATIGAGSTITHDAPPGQLTLSRARQTTVTGWRRPVKKTKTTEKTTEGS
ncbi:MAG: bifunctional UDP-N-acetylglucosamine diphosphorylase/glucosamine-1-phosphate N-acetyltransferase GlmU [Pseudomonadota bacterium]